MRNYQEMKRYGCLYQKGFLKVKESHFSSILKDLNEKEEVLLATVCWNPAGSNAYITNQRIIVRSTSKNGVSYNIPYFSIDYNLINIRVSIAGDKYLQLFFSLENNCNLQKIELWTKDGFPLEETIACQASNQIDRINKEINKKLCTNCKKLNNPKNKHCFNCHAEFDKKTIKVICPDCNFKNDYHDEFCGRCGILLNRDHCPNCGNEIKIGRKFCTKCGFKISGEKTESKTFKELQVKPKTGEIKCPFCGSFLKPPKTWTGDIKTQKTTSTTGNIARGVIFLPWGVVSAVKNKKFIICPHCKMKIIQG